MMQKIKKQKFENAPSMFYDQNIHTQNDDKDEDEKALKSIVGTDNGRI